MVIVLTIAAAVAYYWWSPAANQAAAADIDNARPIAVGSVWVPVYPGARVVGHSASTKDDVTETTLLLKAHDPARELLSFYQAKLKGGRFRVDTYTKSGEGGTIRGGLRNGRAELVVTINAAAEGSEGSITALEKQPSK